MFYSSQSRQGITRDDILASYDAFQAKWPFDRQSKPIHILKPLTMVNWYREQGRNKRTEYLFMGLPYMKQPLICSGILHRSVELCGHQAGFKGVHHSSQSHSVRCQEEGSSSRNIFLIWEAGYSPGGKPWHLFRACESRGTKSNLQPGQES